MKRCISLLMIFALLLACLPQVRIAAAENESSIDAKAVPEQEPMSIDADALSRAWWIEQLVETFEMTVEEQHAPDNYFSDLTGDEAYYRDILVAVQFGVVDIEAGKAFCPDEPTSREFAAQTLNACLGFQLDENVAYTFHDTAEVTYLDAAQVSIDRGWFTLSNGSFQPEKAITAAESATMLADAKAVLESRVIQTSYESTYEFSTDVIEIPNGTELEITPDGVTIFNCPKTLEVGDLFVVWYQDVPCAYVANSVTESEGCTFLTVTAFEDDSAVVNVDAQGMMNTEFVNFIPAEGTEVVYVDEVTGTEYTDARKADAAIAAHADTRKAKQLKTMQLKKTLNIGDGCSATASVKLMDPVLEYKFKSGAKSATVILSAGYELQLRAQTDLMEALGMQKLTLGYWGFPGVGGLDVSLVYSLAGSLTGTFSGTMSVGVDYSPSSGFSVPRSFRSGGFTLVAEATIKAGINAKFGVYDVPCDIVSGYVYAEVGVKGIAEISTYSDGAPRQCVQSAMYLYLECGVSLSVGVGAFQKEFSKDYEIWSPTNSPVRVIHHYEDHREVCSCSRGNVYSNGYFTDAYSNYWSSGWLGGCGSSGFDRNGTPVVVYTYTLDEENNATITGFSGGGSVITIPEKIDGYTVTAIGYRAFINKQYLTGVQLPDSVITIESGAFQNCTSLRSFELPPELKTLGGSAFYGCASLKMIHIPKSIESVGDYDGYKKAGPFATSGIEVVTFEEGTTNVPAWIFHGAANLRSVTLLPTITKISHRAFEGCSALTSIEIPDSVTVIESASFQNCKSLTGIDLPQNLKTLDGSAFYGCSELKSTHIPKSIESIGYYDGYKTGGPFASSGVETVTFEEGTTCVLSRIFLGAMNLKDVTLLPTMTKISHRAFEGCSALTSIEIPDSVTVIESASFAGCANLAELKLPGNLKTLDGSAFYGCSDLKSIHIPKTLENVGNYDGYKTRGPFASSGIETVTFEEGTTSVFSWCFNGATNLKSVTLLPAMTEIGAYAFDGCTSLETITIPNSVENIGGNAFYGCTSLETITIPNSVKSMGEKVFQNCANLKNATLSNNCQSIPKNAFNACSSLEEVILPEAVTSIGDSAFLNCSALQQIVLPGTLRSIGHDAFKKNGLTAIVIPEGCNSIANAAFAGCEAMTKAEIADTVTSFGTMVFDGCESLSEVKLGTGITKIPESAFANCSVLESIELPYGVSEIGKNAFANDTKLTSVTIPRRTTTIATSAFSYPNILTIYGVAGTTAETYAAEIGATFVAIDIPATEIVLNHSQLTLNKGESTTLCATITPSNFTDEAAWKSSNTSVATVTDIGVVKAVGLGECTISFIAGNKKVNCMITVVQPVTSISLNNSNVSLNAEETFTLTANVYPSNATNKAVSWSSSDENIATVDQNGVITAISKGTATITATAQDGNGAKGSCTVTVMNDLYIVTAVEELQSLHPYTTNCSDVWQYSIEGAASLAVTFSAETSVEEGSDYIHVYTADGTLVGSYTGAALAGKTIIVTGDTVKIKLVSDGSYCEYGFAVTSVEAVNDDVEPTEPSEEPTEPSEEPTEPSEEPTTPSDEPTEPSEEPTTPSEEPSEPSEEPSEPSEEPSEPSEEPTEPSEEPTEPSEEPTEPSEEPTTPSEEPTEPSEEPTTPSEEPSEPSEELTTPSEEPTEPSEEPTTPSEEPSEPSEEPTEPSEEPSEPTEQPNEPEIPTENPFTDVKESDYFATPVLWAVGKNITNGMSATSFAPNAPCTRGQIVTFLWRACGSPEPTSTKNNFKDVKAGEYYYKAVLWAVENGITTGLSATTFGPNATCTRAQVATFLWRSQGEPEPASTNNPFSDVKTSDYYFKAVLWAVENEVTQGMGGGKFAPNASCTRGQIVTFLYRAIA